MLSNSISRFRSLSGLTILKRFKFEYWITDKELEEPPPPSMSPPKRCGTLAVKVGMMGIWDKWGRRYPVTVLHMDDVQVTQIKTEDTNGYTALQLGAGSAKLRKVKKPQLYHTIRNGIAPKRKLSEFIVSPDMIIPLGTPMLCQHFVPGQFLDVQGVSRGKGFQGVVKRYNFKMQPASHGTSRTHRALGSTGHCQTPGRVAKGKKMAGHMGCDTKTVRNLQLIKIDVERNLLLVKGSIPGAEGTWVRVRDAIQCKTDKKRNYRYSKGEIQWGSNFPKAPPVPTYFAPDEVTVAVGGDDKHSVNDGLFMPLPEQDPYDNLLSGEGSLDKGVDYFANLM